MEANQRVKVSVISTSFNGEKYILQCLESALRQRDVAEVILVDDGSTDHTIEIVRKNLPTVKVFTQENSGVSSARNRGLSIASCDVVSFIDQDDFFVEDGLANLVDMFMLDRSVSMIYSDYNEVDENGRLIATIEQPDVVDSSLRKLLSVNCSATVCCLFKKTALIDVGGFDDGIMGCEDWDLYIRLAAAEHTLSYVPKVCFSFRKHMESNSKKFFLMWNAFQALERKHRGLTLEVLGAASEIERRDRFLNDNLRFLYGPWDEDARWIVRRINRFTHFCRLIFTDLELARNISRRALHKAISR